MARCWHCKAESPAAHYDRVVYNKTALFGPWEGWRMAGRFLIGPGGTKVTPERLEGLLWVTTHQVEKRTVCPAAIVSLPARELFEGRA